MIICYDINAVGNFATKKKKQIFFFMGENKSFKKSFNQCECLHVQMKRSPFNMAGRMMIIQM